MNMQVVIVSSIYGINVCVCAHTIINALWPMQPDATQYNTAEYGSIKTLNHLVDVVYLLLHFIMWYFFFTIWLRLLFFVRARSTVMFAIGGGSEHLVCTMMKQQPPPLWMLIPNCYPTNMIYIYLSTLSFYRVRSYWKPLLHHTKNHLIFKTCALLKIIDNHNYTYVCAHLQTKQAIKCIAWHQKNDPELTTPNAAFCKIQF